MDANLNFLSTPAVNPVSSGEISSPLTAKSMGDKAMLGKEFANIMRSLLPESERQHLAAAQPFADLPGLRNPMRTAWPLLPNPKVWTTRPFKPCLGVYNP
jgi:hypothetical protein